MSADPFDRPCPRCGAGVGQPCRWRSRTKRRPPDAIHKRRADAPVPRRDGVAVVELLDRRGLAIVRCPFCGQLHAHGAGDGPVVPHCTWPFDKPESNYLVVGTAGAALQAVAVGVERCDISALVEAWRVLLRFPDAEQVGQAVAMMRAADPVLVGAVRRRLIAGVVA